MIDPPEMARSLLDRFESTPIGTDAEVTLMGFTIRLSWDCLQVLHAGSGTVARERRIYHMGRRMKLLHIEHYITWAVRVATKETLSALKKLGDI